MIEASSGWLSIGEYAQATGLPVSAVRFYDREGVLRPAAVDPRTGYRRYEPDQVVVGQLAAGLRRVGVSVGDLRTLLERRADAEFVMALLDRHLERLEAGLADARAEIDRLRAGLTSTSAASAVNSDAVLSVVELSTSHLRRAIRAVEFALPPAGGADQDVDAVAFRLVRDRLIVCATDRFRLAVCEVPCLVSAGEVQLEWAVAHSSLSLIGADRGPGDGQDRLGQQDLQVLVSNAKMRLVTAAGEVAVPLASGIPGLHDLIDEQTHSWLLEADSEELIRQLRSPEHTSTGSDGVRMVSLVEADGDPGRAVVVDPASPGADGGVLFDQRFLMEAIAAGPGGPVRLGVRPDRPLAIRFGDDPSTMSILMPRRG